MKRKLSGITMIYIVIAIVFVIGTTAFVLERNDSLHKYLELSTGLAEDMIGENLRMGFQEPSTVVNVLAEDMFLIDAIENGQETDVINRYLQNYKDRLEYEVIMFADARTGQVYDGETVRMVEEDEEWYHNLLDFPVGSTSLDVSKNTEGGDLKIGINISKSMEGKDGELIGIVDTHIETMSIKELLEYAAEEYHLELILAEEDGKILAQTGKRQGGNLFAKSSDLAFLKGKLNDLEPVKTWLKGENLFSDDRFVQTKYLSDFECYLIALEDNEEVHDQYQRKMIFILLMITGIFLLVLFFMIRQVRLYRVKIVSDAATDELTGLPNRKAFMQMYMNASEKALLKNAQIFMLDVDKFKTINDTYGHAAGDEALALLGGKLKEITEQNGFAGRWGGDEFIGILYCDIAEAQKLLEKLSQEVKQSEFGKKIGMTLSIGVSGITEEKPLTKLTEKADEALYEAKKNGRDRICVNQGDKEEDQ